MIFNSSAEERGTATFVDEIADVAGADGEVMAVALPPLLGAELLTGPLVGSCGLSWTTGVLGSVIASGGVKDVEGTDELELAVVLTTLATTPFPPVELHPVSSTVAPTSPANTDGRINDVIAMPVSLSAGASVTPEVRSPHLDHRSTATQR